MIITECIHNSRCRYTNGFYCEDCNTFFDKNSPIYRSDELLSSIWMVLHNIDAGRRREGKERALDAINMRDKIGVGIRHENYEELIAEAEIIMIKYGVNSGSASFTLK